MAGQLAATVPLLVLAGLLARGAVGTTAGVSLGFEPDRIAAVGTDLNVIGYERERADRFIRTALERVQSMPGVEAAALASRAPLDLSFSPQNILVPGLHGPADRGTSVGTAGVSADYFDTLGVPLLQGRTFTTADTPESPRVAIVSHAVAQRFWPEATAVGRRFRLAEWDGFEYEIVGVSADYKVLFPTEDPASARFAIPGWPTRRSTSTACFGRSTDASPASFRGWCGIPGAPRSWRSTRSSGCGALPARTDPAQRHGCCARLCDWVSTSCAARPGGLALHRS